MKFNIPLANIFDYKNKFTLIYGPQQAGKPHMLTGSGKLRSRRKKVYFLDTEGGFSVERLSQLGEIAT